MLFNQKELEIDFAELEYKRKLETDRLEDVIRYTKNAKCRQGYLISYFGEDAGNWKCENCDLCSGNAAYSRKLTEREQEAVMTILLAVQAFGGRLGGGRLSQILAGARRPEITRCGYDRDPFFGSLKSLSQNNILLFLYAT